MNKTAGILEMNYFWWGRHLEFGRKYCRRRIKLKTLVNGINPIVYFASVFRRGGSGPQSCQVWKLTENQVLCYFLNRSWKKRNVGGLWVPDTFANAQGERENDSDRRCVVFWFTVKFSRTISNWSVPKKFISLFQSLYANQMKSSECSRRPFTWVHHVEWRSSGSLSPTFSFHLCKWDDYRHRPIREWER